ncbi:PLP-dependent aminotransferase family protein [Mumia sp. DW29H23]|uniref:MocR-like pyridoxine biosynthesis transcription factor PdxR n=1 Tax=Mumia sp. DW29H23 TaxID=3421241 RepID=UPI003D68C13E
MRTWAIGDLDLHVRLSPTRPTRSLAQAIREAVVDGRLRPGTRLPASRRLAQDLGIARNSVADAYGLLVAEGWLEARAGAGTWVGERVGGGPAPSPAPPVPAPSLDLRAGIPDASTFPRAEWAAAVGRALEAAPDTDLGYTDVQGTRALREALADYLGRARGVRTDADRLVVGNGFGDLLGMLCRVLAARGARRFAVEEYGHEAHRRIVAAAGLEVVAVPVDGEGIDVEALARLDVAGVLVTAAHQFPTGVPLSARRRVALTRWAERTEALVVEDDYDGEFRYDRRAIGALQALAPDHVAYVGTASKALAPAVALGWAAVPAGAVAEVRALRSDEGRRPAAVHELTLAQLLRDYGYDRNVRRLRQHYRRRREALDAALRAGAPGCALVGLSAGLQVVVALADGADEDAVVAQARLRGVRVEGLAHYAAGAAVRGSAGARAPAVVVGYGAASPSRFDAAIAALVDAITAARPGSAGA